MILQSWFGRFKKRQKGIHCSLKICINWCKIWSKALIKNCFSLRIRSYNCNRCMRRWALISKHSPIPRSKAWIELLSLLPRSTITLNCRYLRNSRTMMSKTRWEICRRKWINWWEKCKELRKMFLIIGKIWCVRLKEWRQAFRRKLIGRVLRKG